MAASTDRGAKPGSRPGPGEVALSRLDGPAAGEASFEVVERKGKGHPDTICDAVMEEVSRALCRSYRERFGRILHHNCDKGLLVAGQVERRLGGGRVLEPMRLVFGDRADPGSGKARLDVKEIAIEAAKAWLRKNLPRIDPDRHLTYQVELRPGSQELAGLFQAPEPEASLGANDTSAVAGYAPLSETERLVIETERYLNSEDFKLRFPQTGEDVKVLGVRKGRSLDLTVAMPLIDRHVRSPSAYFEAKRAIVADLRERLGGRLESIQELTLGLNLLDDASRGMDGMYLSVLGTSAEDADSGEVGRGNQVNGLISLHRPRGAEAAAGKNPVSHVGKIYSVLAHLLAGRLHASIAGLREVVVFLCSRIGDPVDRPRDVAVEVRLQPGCALGDVESSIRSTAIEEIERIPDLCEELVRGVHPIC